MKKVLFLAMALFTIALTAKAEAVTESCGTTVTISATPKTGYHFVKWSDGDTNANRTIVVTGNISLTAIFAVDTYTIKVESADDTQGTVSVTK